MPNQHADYDEPAHSGGMLANLVFFNLRGYIRGCNLVYTSYHNIC